MSRAWAPGGGPSAAAAPRLILASRSPQRSAILERLGVPFEVRPSGVAEIEAGEPRAVALENALRKARAVRDVAREVRHAAEEARDAADAHVGGGRPVLGVDTVVELDGRIYGKPADERSARATLAELSARTHTVVSGLALLDGERERSAVAVTRVRFRALDEDLLDWYVATGEWRERAGGYAIQGAGAALVHEIAGDYENVVGLPVAALLDLFPELLRGALSTCK